MPTLPSPSRSSAISSLTTTLIIDESQAATPSHGSDAPDANPSAEEIVQQQPADPGCGKLLGSAGYWTAVFTITNAALGAGVLSYPFAFLNAGMLPGALLLVLFSLLCFCSLCIVTSATHHVKEKQPSLVSISFGEVVREVCGVRTARLVDALIVLQGLGACWSYLVLLADVLAPVAFRLWGPGALAAAAPAAAMPAATAASALSSLGGRRLWGSGALAAAAPAVAVPAAAVPTAAVASAPPSGSFLGGSWQSVLLSDAAEARTLVMCVASLLGLGLCLLRRISALRYSSALAVAAVLFTVAMLIYDASTKPCREGSCDDEHGVSGWCTAEQLSATPEHCPAGLDGVSLWPQGSAPFADVLRSLPLIGFGLQCHIQAAAVYGEMEAPLRRPAVGRRASLLAMALIFSLYLPTGMGGYLRFGAQTQGDVLTNFDVSDKLADVARMCIATTALCAFPMQHFPARKVLHAAWASWRQLPAEMSTGFLVAEAVGFCGAVLALSILAGNSLSSVFQLVGAVTCSTAQFTMPGLIWLRLGHGWSRRLLGGLLLAVGLFVLVAGSAVTIVSLFT